MISVRPLKRITLLLALAITSLGSTAQILVPANKPNAAQEALIKRIKYLSE